MVTNILQMLSLCHRLQRLLAVGGILFLVAAASAQNPSAVEPKGVLGTAESKAAAQTDGENPAATDTAPATPAASTLVWWNREITVFRSTTASQPPEARSRDALKKIEKASDALLEVEVSTESAEIDGETVSY